MATSTWYYGSGFTNTINVASEKLVFSNEAGSMKAISVGAFNPNTLVTNLVMDTVNGVADNVRYVSETEVSINEDPAVILNFANMAQSQCTVKVNWNDDPNTTTLSSIRFYVFDGVTPTTTPTGVTFCAFENDGSAIQTAGASSGDAWRSSVGIGGSAAALKLTDQAAAVQHDFFIGISAKPTEYGTHTGIKMRLEFDVA